MQIEINLCCYITISKTVTYIAKVATDKSSRFRFSQNMLKNTAALLKPSEILLITKSKNICLIHFFNRHLCSNSYLKLGERKVFFYRFNLNWNNNSKKQLISVAESKLVKCGSYWLHFFTYFGSGSSSSPILPLKKLKKNLVRQHKTVLQK